MTADDVSTQKTQQAARNGRLLLAGCMAFFLVNGALVLMTSSLLVFLMQDYNLTYDQGGLLLTIQAVGNIATSFLSGPLALRVGRKRTLVLSAIGFAVSLGLIALEPPLLALQLALAGCADSRRCSGPGAPGRLSAHSRNQRGRRKKRPPKQRISAGLAPLPLHAAAFPLCRHRDRL